MNYKVELSDNFKKEAKSDGARVLSFVKVFNNSVLLFSIYNKGDKDSISDKEIKDLIKNL